MQNAPTSADRRPPARTVAGSPTRAGGLAAFVGFIACGVGFCGLVACGRVELGSMRLETTTDASSPSASPDEVAPVNELAPGHATELPPLSVAPPSGGVPNESGSASAGADGGAASAPTPVGSGTPIQDASTDAATAPPEPGPASCRGATEFCGPSSDSCCLSLPVAGGALSLPIDAGGTRVNITLSSFWLDKYEVTVGRFRAFLASYDDWYGSGNPLPGAGAHPRAPESGWTASDSLSLPHDAQEFERLVRACNTIPLSTLDLPNSSSRIPLNCVTWPEAAAFCAWDGARLPTYAEWYHAAAGGAEDRIYPWGNEPTPSRLYALYGCALGLERPECTAAYVLPVGSHPSGAGLFAQDDLAGSMTEWLLDGELSAYVDGCVDCVGVPANGHHFWKGGSWVDTPTLLENTYFAIVEPTLRMPFLGLRCARDQP